MSFMFCPKCGAFNDRENLWCIKCGYNIESIPEAMRGTQTDDANRSVYNDGKYSEDTVVHTGAVVRTGAGKKSKKVKDYFVQSILVAIFCSITFGVAAIIFSGMTQVEQKVGNREKAESYATKTGMFCWIALAIGIVKYLFVIVFIIAMKISAPYYFYPYLF